jgi:hypothetical protein
VIDRGFLFVLQRLDCLLFLQRIWWFSAKFPRSPRPLSVELKILLTVQRIRMRIDGYVLCDELRNLPSLQNKNNNLAMDKTGVFTVNGMLCRLLEINAWVLRLYRRQSLMNGLIK